MTERSSAERRPYSLLAALFIFVSVLSFYLVQTKDSYVQGSWNDASRLATIDSLINRQVWEIDASPFLKWTGDKLFLKGHWYSTKPPLLQALTAAAYRITWPLARDRFAPDQAGLSYQWLTFLSDGIPSALMVALLFLCAVQLTGTWGRAMLASLLPVVATMVWPYSLVLNNHVPAAAALLVSFWLTLRAHDSGPRLVPQIVFAGFAAALAASFDLAAAFLSLALFVMVASRHRWRALPFVLGALAPVIATAICDLQITGSILPPYFATEGYRFAGSNWTATVAALRASSNVVLYGFRSLLGDHGLVAYCPLLLWPLFGLVVACRRKWGWRRESVLLAAGVFAETLFILVSTDNFGGRAYGARWFIVWVPLIFVFLPISVPYPPRSTFTWLNLALLGAATLMSTVSVLQGVSSTWAVSRPLLYVEMHSTSPYIALRTGLTPGVPLIRNLTCPRGEFPSQALQYDAPVMGHSLQANFGDQIMLLGYDLPSRRAHAGDSFPITLYWKSLTQAEESYTQFSRLLDLTLTMQGGLDRRPAGTNTACWESGEIIEDRYSVPVFAQARPGVYALQIGLYTGPGDAARYLTLVQDGQLTSQAQVTIGPIKIDGPPSGVVVFSAAPQHAVDETFGTSINLVGYDLEQSADSLKLRLYWQSIAPAEANYSTFVHLVDGAGALVAQVDGPPGRGAYPTSLWDPGEIISDNIDLRLPQDMTGGQYNLLVGLYDPISGIRLGAAGSPDNALRLTRVEINR